MDLFCRIQVTDDLELIGIPMVTILRDEKFPFLTCLPVILSSPFPGVSYFSLTFR